MTPAPETQLIQRAIRIADVIDLEQPPKTAQNWLVVRDRELSVRHRFQASVDAWERRRRRAERSFYAPLALVVVCMMLTTLWPDLSVDAAVWLAVAALPSLLAAAFLLSPAYRYPEVPHRLFNDADFQPVRFDSCKDLLYLAEADPVIADYVHAALAQGRELLCVELEAIMIRMDRLQAQSIRQEAAASCTNGEVQLNGA